jgi:hypothetical protein
MNPPEATPSNRDDAPEAADTAVPGHGPVVVGPEGPRRSPLLRWFLILAAGLMIWFLTHIALQSLAYVADFQGAAWLRHTHLVLLPVSLILGWWALDRWLPRVSP